MAYQISARAKQIAEQKTKTPNLVLSISGVETTYSVIIAEVIPNFDAGFFFDEGLFFDTPYPVENQNDYISLTGTSDTVQQQLEPDKAASSSTASIKVKLIDINGEITQLITPGLVVDDILYRDCQVFFGFQGLDLDDYIELFNGKITEILSEPGSSTLTISHPDELKRSDIFVKAETKLTQAVDFKSETIQDLFYQTRNDVVGVVDITYVNDPGLGNDALINVTGNSISIQIETGFTTAKTIKKKIEADEDASQLVSVKITGTPTATQTPQGPTSLLSDDEIFLEDVTQLLSPVGDLFRTYIQIEDELIEYTAIDLGASKVTGCIRESLNTVGNPHENEKEVSSFYKLGDGTFDNSTAIDLALNVLLSGAPSPFVEDLDVESFVYIAPSLSVDNAIWFNNINLERTHGIVAGSTTMTVSGATNGANNFTDRLVLDVVRVSGGSYVVVDGAALISETSSPAVASFKTIYNVLPDGAGLIPVQVDIAEFERNKAVYASSMVAYELYLKETTQSKDLVNKRLFLPSALYPVPRKGKVSVGFTAPPLYNEHTKVLGLESIKRPSQIDISRSVNKNFYNAVVYRYNQDSITDKYLSGKVRLSNDSTNRILSPTKALKIDADGIRPGTESDDLISINERRFLQRYQYGAESLPIEVPVDVGWTMEVGDAIIVGDDGLQIADTKNGTTEFKPRMFEITNKSYNWRTGQIKLMITDTAFGIDVRYGTWSPSSIIGSGSTSSSIVITDSFGTSAPNIEKDKWSNYIGREIHVHSEDFSASGTTYIDSFDPGDDYKMIVNPALGFTPSAGYIVDIVNYPDIDTGDTLYKVAHVFWDPTLEVVSGASSTQFDVSVPDAAKLFVGSIIRVHSEDYSIDSGLTGKLVTDVTGTTVTCDDLGFTPASGQKIDLVGFYYDNGKPYAWV